MAVKHAVVPAAARGTSDSDSGRYAPVRHSLGKGGMGTVELATRREGRFVRVYAIKRMSTELKESEAGRAMFMDEAHIAGLLRHSNVVSVLDVGEDEHGPYLVMDYVKGLDLAQLMKGMRARSQHTPIDIAIRILADVAAGLHAAHELRGPRGEPLHLVHRDVSPHNVLLDFDGIVRLTDFGVAKSTGQSSRTSTGVIKGKIAYMAPEQLQFEPIDRRSDLFALGVIGFELVTGRRLFRGASSTETARAVLRAEIPDLASDRDDVPPALHELLLEMLAKDPARRPASAAIVRRRLETILREWSLDHEEPLDLAEFLAENFDEHRAQVETMYAAVLSSAESTRDEAAPPAELELEVASIDAPTSATTPDPSVIARPDPAPRTLRLPIFVALAAGATLGLAGALWWSGVFARPEREPAPAARAPSIAEPEPEVRASDPIEAQAPPAPEPPAEVRAPIEPVGRPARRARSRRAVDRESGRERALDGLWMPGREGSR
jgi:eukaryotic-like serine/threonine-protein kinase